MMEHSQYLSEVGATLEFIEKAKPADARSQLSIDMTQRHCKLFKIRYNKKRTPPACVTEGLENQLPDDSSDEEDKERESDSECEATFD